MKDVKKKFNLLNRLKWVGGLFGIAVYLAVAEPFGDGIAMLLCFLFTTTFYRICRKEAMRTICEYVAADLKKVVVEAGHQRCIVEIKGINEGLITRVYLIGAGPKSPLYGKAVLNHISKSWYKKNVWVTQMLDVAAERDIEDASMMLDEELYQQVKKARSEAKNVKSIRENQFGGSNGKIRYQHKMNVQENKKTDDSSGNTEKEKDQ